MATPMDTDAVEQVSTPTPSPGFLCRGDSANVCGDVDMAMCDDSRMATLRSRICPPFAPPTPSPEKPNPFHRNDSASDGLLWSGGSPTKGHRVDSPASRLSISVYAGCRPIVASPNLVQSLLAEEEDLFSDWQSLPDVMVGTVLTHLEGRDVAALRRTCKHWHSSASDAVTTVSPTVLEPLLMASAFPNLRALDLSNATEHITTERLAVVGREMAGLTTLNLGRHHRMIVTNVTDESLAALSGLSRLSTLNMAQCVHVSDLGMKLVRDRFPELTSLNISGCVQVTDAGLHQLAQLSKMAVLEVPWCLKVTDKGLAALSPLSSTLSHLNISGCQLVTETGVATLACFTKLTTLTLLHLGYANPAVTDQTIDCLRPLQSLTSLSLSGLQVNTAQVTDAGVYTIVQSFPALRHLHLMWLSITNLSCAMLTSLQGLESLSLRGCHHVTGDGVAHLAALTNLEVLNLLNLPDLNVTDGTIRSLMPLRGLKSLSVGDTHVGNNVTDKGLVALASFPRLEALSLWWLHWQPSDIGLLALPAVTELKSLDLQGCVNVRDASLFALAPLKKLASLQLARCTKVTDAGMLAITHLTALSSLNLCSCYHITDRGLQSIGRIESLQTLNLDGCHEITDTGVAALAPLSNLETLNMSCCERVSGLGFAALRGLEQLGSLNLSCCSYLKDIGLQAIGSFSSLTKLDLCQCVEITDLGVAALSPLTGLTGLDLAYCPQVSDASLQGLATLTALTTLKLNGCSAVTDAGLVSIQPLKQLLTVHLDRCYRLTDDGVASLSALTGLTSLRLARCHQLSNRGVASLGNLTRLSTLSLAFCTSITEEGMRSLSALTALASLEL